MFYKSTSASGGADGSSAGLNKRPASRRTFDAPVHRPKEREMIFGIRAVIEAVDAGKTLDKVLLRRDMSSALAKELLERLERVGSQGVTQVQRVPVERLNRFTDKNHQGVIAFLSPVDFFRIEDLVQAAFERGETPLVMVLDGITDVRNFGAIARTCACAGVHALVIPARGSASVNGDAVKTSAGALHSLPVCKVDNLQDTLRYLRDSGLALVAATEHASLSYTATDLTRPLAIVMGSEEKGIFDANLRLCTDRVRIPITGTIESLNVSVAAGVMLFEALRQRTLDS